MVVRNILLILAVCAFCETYRTRRQTTTYIIDIKVVTDVEMYKRWSTYVRETSSETDVNKLDILTQKKIREYVSLCLHQANVRLATLNRYISFNVQLQLVAIEFNYSRSANDNVGQTLDNFKIWLLNNYQSNVAYDHVMLFTSLPLTSVSGGDKDVQGLGRAYVGTMCNKDGSSSSVVEDRGGFQSSYQIAHEIAHSLGARHDGESGCQDDSYNLMSEGWPSTGTVSTQWVVSRCTATSIKSNITAMLSDSRRSCLESIGTPLDEFVSSSASQAGRNYSANQQCQMMHGSKSHVCFGSRFSEIVNMCTSMYCLDPVASELGKTSICVKYFAAEGTLCADKQSCSLGECSIDNSAPIIGDCPLGNNVLDILGYSCADYIKANPFACYQQQIWSNCCESCNKIKTNSAACPYGDRGPGCKKASCSLDASYDVECCGTCQTNNKDSTTAKGPTIVRDSAPGQTGRHVMALLVGCSTLATLFIRNLL